MLPLTMSLPESQALPALVVVRLPRVTHFVVAGAAMPASSADGSGHRRRFGPPACALRESTSTPCHSRRHLARVGGHGGVPRRAAPTHAQMASPLA